MIDRCKQLFMVRTVEPKWIVIVLLVHLLQSIFINLVLFRTGVLAPFRVWSLGLINETLLANLVSMLCVFPLLFLKLGVKTKEVGLTPAAGTGKNSVLRGAMWTLVAFLIIHVVVIVIAFTLETGFEVTNWFSKAGLNRIGLFLGQIFGNALYEEVLFRGFLLPQFVLILKKKNRKWSWTKCFWLGLIASQLIFALMHIPNRIYQGTYFSSEGFVPAALVSDMQMVFVAGMLFAAIYLMTQNLYAAIGLHALVNYAPLIVDTGVVGLGLSAYLVILVVYLWNRYSDKLGRPKSSEKV